MHKITTNVLVHCTELLRKLSEFNRIRKKQKPSALNADDSTFYMSASGVKAHNFSKRASLLVGHLS